MNYRTFGPLDWKVSALGFGVMRLPTIDDDPGQIDEPQARRMIRYAIDHGVNYVDTAYPYPSEQSEPFLGRVLQDGYRERVRLATKMPCWKVEDPDDFDRFLDEQLERLQTDVIDFYLLHGLNKKSWGKMQELQVFDWAERAMSEGRFRYLGFSFHDEYQLFEEIVDAYEWTFCQIQYNYMDEAYQAGTPGLEYAADKGLAVVVMEPIRGGQLAVPPAAVTELWEQAPVQRPPAEWALQWVWNHPQVSVVLSGMSTLCHVAENLVSAAHSAPNSLSQEELELIARARDTYRGLSPIPCTDCGYCQPCPEGVRISRIFSIYNEAQMYGHLESARRFYGWLKEEERPDRCAQCGECLEKCPQGIEIMDWLEKVEMFFAE